MPDLGLLLDVDGPIASPVTRTVAIPSILDDLVALAGAGVPIAFITGRSDAFVRANLVAPLRAVGLDEALARPGARMFGVFEKGGTWAQIDASGLGALTVDDSLAFSPSLVADIRGLLEAEFGDTMFFDDTKRAMISIEQRTDVSSEAYRAAQARFDAAAFDIIAAHGLGVQHGDRVRPDVNGEVTVRVDSTIISTDIESAALDKSLGAQRALAFFAELGALPTRWRSVGDSRSDYRMADHVHERGFEVAHVDVRPADGVLEKPYRVIIEPDVIHDEAGAVFLQHWVREFGLA